MSKKRVNITLDPNLHSQAKELGLNISGVTERALRAYIQSLDGDRQQVGLFHTASDGVTEDFDNQIEDANPSSVGESRSIEEILSEYESYGKTVLGRSESTLDQHTRYVGRLLRHTAKPPTEIEEVDLIEYIESEQPMSEAKNKNILSSFRIFFREFIGSDVAANFKIPSISPNPTEVPSKKELQVFYDAIESVKYQVIFLMYATSGLRSAELLELTMDDINESDRMVVPDSTSETKQTWVSFYNIEAERVYNRFKPERAANDSRVFQASKPTVNKRFRRISEESGIKITPQRLRRWFASEMSSLGVESSYIDAFCGRTPESVLEKHYLDYSPRKLRSIYTSAEIEVFD